MSVEVKGDQKVINDLEQRLGQAKMQTVSDEALKAGARVFVAELKRQFSSWKDTGASHDEITISEPMTIGSNRTIRIHWKGPKNRYRIIHLNEWGTVNNPNPKGKGSIARAMRSAQASYRRVIKEAIERGI